MQRLIITLFVISGWLCLPAANAFSQGIDIGINAGVNFATANTDEDLSLSSRRGLILGGAVELTFFRPLTFRIGAEYIEKGAEFKITTSSGVSSTGTYNLNYIDFPVSLRLNLGEPAFDPFIFAGTTVGTLLSAQQEFDGGSSQDVKDQVNPVELSLDAGGGVSFEIASRLSIVAQAIYSFGLTNAGKEGSVLDKSSWKARNFELIAGLSYHLGM